MTELEASIGEVTDSSSSKICVEIADPAVFEANKSRLSIGQYLLLQTGNTQYVLAVITAIRASHTEKGDAEIQFRFAIDTQPVGTGRQVRASKGVRSTFPCRPNPRSSRRHPF